MHTQVSSDIWLPPFSHAFVHSSKPTVTHLLVLHTSALLCISALPFNCSSYSHWQVFFSLKDHHIFTFVTNTVCFLVLVVLWLVCFDLFILTLVLDHNTMFQLQVLVIEAECFLFQLPYFFSSIFCIYYTYPWLFLWIQMNEI